MEMQRNSDSPLGKLLRPSAAFFAFLLQTASPELVSQVTSPSGQHSATKFGLGRPTCSTLHQTAHPCMYLPSQTHPCNAAPT